MATYAAYLATDMVFGSLPAGYVTRLSSTEIVAVNGAWTFVIAGYGISYSGNYVTGGTVTEVAYYYGSGVAYEAYNLNASAPYVIDRIAYGDTPGLASYVLNGSDDIFGSSYGDRLAGYAGNDFIAPGTGDDEIYGGPGFDTVVLPGRLSDYLVTYISPGVYDVQDVNFANGNEGIDRYFDVEAMATLADGSIVIADLFGAPAWYKQSGNVEIVAATYEFFLGWIPNAGGFAYLINSPNNPADLSDPYYSAFNTENRYINFASNLGTEGAGKSFFDAAFGSLTFEQAVMLAYQEIMGKPLAGGAYNFFMGAHGFYEDVAEQRVVRPGVDLDDATKIVAIGSILNEAVKNGQGPYADAIEYLVADVYPDGQSVMLGGDMFMYS